MENARIRRLSADQLNDSQEKVSIVRKGWLYHRECVKKMNKNLLFRIFYKVIAPDKKEREFRSISLIKHI